MKVFVPQYFYKSTFDQKSKALKAITFIDFKRSGKVKGRTVANGSVQRLYIPKEEASSPTVSTESVLMVSVINAMEERVVAVCNVSGAFLQAYMDDFVLVVFENKMVELIVETEPNYSK